MEQLHKEFEGDTINLLNGKIYRQTTATTLTSGPYINQIKVGDSVNFIRGTAAHDEIAELREMIERLKGKPYYMKVSCHNCGASLTIDSTKHLIKCPYCRTAYFSGTQLVNAGIR